MIKFDEISRSFDGKKIFSGLDLEIGKGEEVVLSGGERQRIAAMATIGIVALQAMMTGTILGCASPSVAIKYQIIIMIAILVSTIISVLYEIRNAEERYFYKINIRVKNLCRSHLILFFRH